MKFKKRNLTNEIGLPISNKKTYTTNKKQKVVVSESQLQRLIGIINEQNVNTPGAPNPKDYKKGGTDPKYLADKKSFIKKYKSDNTPQFNQKKWSGGFEGTIMNFIKNKNFTGAKSFLDGRLQLWKKKLTKAKGKKWIKQLKYKIEFSKKMLSLVDKESKVKPLKEQTLVYQCENGTCGVAFVPNAFLPQYATLADCQNSGCGSTDLGHTSGDDFATSNKPPTSPKRKMCCRDRNGVITSSVNGRCPKSSTKVPCKGTPPTQGTITTEDRDMGMNKQKGKFDTPKNMKACKAAGGSESLCAKHLGAGTLPPKPTSLGRKKWLLGGLLCCSMDMPCCAGSPIDDVMGTFEESRTLKTTNPINESDIKDMKEWFNRVNKSGRGYNPSKI